MDKKELRALHIQLRKQMTDDTRHQASQNIVESIKKHPRFKEAKVVALFYPMGYEVNVLSLISNDKHYVFPRVEEDGIHFYPYHEEMQWKKSSFGVMEPTGIINMDDQIDLMIAPALAISKDLYRLGYGKGYYDQFLFTHRPTYVIGVIYRHEWIEHLPIDSHDQRLDDVIKG